MVKCPVCGRGELVKEKRKSKLYGFSLGEYMAEVCSRCSEIFWTEEDVALMENMTKDKDIKLRTRTKGR
jgi:YgiT-type zinc finger domain-containing protein